MQNTHEPNSKPVYIDSPTHLETRGIEVIGHSERRGKPHQLFGVWAAPMVSVLNFTIGASLTVVLGLEIWQAIAVSAVSCLLWVFPGIVATSGPAAGTSSSVISRAFYGVIGNRVSIAFNWVIAGVFLALNWVASSFIGAELLSRAGMDKPTALVLVTIVVAAVTVLVAAYGHALILRAYNILTIALLAVFLLVTSIILPTVDWSFQQPEPLSGTALWSSVTIGFAILASTPLSFSNSADMARYLPEDAKRSHIIAATALGGAIPTFFFTAIGALLGSVVSSDALAFGIEFALLEMLPTWLVPVFVLAVIVNTVALNGMTTYTASMAFQSIGVPIRRIPSAVLVGALGATFTLVLVTSTTLLDSVNIMLQVLILISAPGITVYCMDIILRRNQYDGVELFDERKGAKFWYTGGFSIPGLTAGILGGAAASLFLTTDFWSGPIARELGFMDLSVPVAIIVSGTLYYLLTRKNYTFGDKH